jgi:DNA-binding CsgD family transcriptional regulator
VIVGRVAELARLDSLIADVEAARGGRVLVVGEPGIGKSALLGAVARRAIGRGVRVLRAASAPGQADLSFGLVDDLGRRMGEAIAPESTSVGVRAAALLEALGSLAAEAPVLLVIDDAHDADVKSLAALTQVLERAIDTPVGALVSSRPDASAALATWPRLDLRALDVEAGVGVLRSVLGSGLPVDALARLVAAQFGNPLALADSPAWLSDEQRDGRAAIPSRLPCSPALVRSWRATLDPLPDRTRTALVDLAVADGRRDLLEALLRTSEVTIDDLDPAMDVGIVVDVNGRPDLARGPVRSVVLASEPSARVRNAHRRAAEAAEALDLLPDVVVPHWVASVATADGAVASRVEAQARRAEQLDMLFVAYDAFRAAALLSTTAADRVARARTCISLVILYGLDYAGSSEVIRLLDGAELDPETLVWIDWLQAVERGETDPVSSLSGQIEAIRRTRLLTPEAAHSQLLVAALNAWTQGRVDEGLQAAREYADLEQQFGAEWPIEPCWTGAALMAAGLFQCGQVTQAMERRADAIEQAAQADPEEMGFDRLLTTVFLDDVLLDTSDEARNRLEVATQRAADESHMQAALLGIRAWQARARGEWDTARRMLARGRPIAWATGAFGVQLGMAALTAELSAASGEDDLLKQVAEQLRAQGVRAGDARRLATLDRALGLRALVDGRFDEALVALRAAADVAFLGRGLRDAVLPARVDVVEALVRIDSGDEARRRAVEVRELLWDMGLPSARALAHRVDALVAAGEEAAGHYASAIAEHARGGDPFECARTQLLYGEHLRRERQRGAARSVLIPAERTFDILGAAPWLARTRAELRAAGGHAEEPVDASVLTAQERAVAAAAAEGMSNREVAEALFLSPRTVEYHLGNAYRKLGVHGRGALARRLAALD